MNLASIKEFITFDDFVKLDICVGTITAISEVSRAGKVNNHDEN
jgi:hypothetical protein